MVSVSHPDVATKTSLRQKFQKARFEFAQQPATQSVADTALNTHALRLIQDLSAKHKSLRVCLHRPIKDEAHLNLTPHSSYFYPRIQQDDLSFLRPHHDANWTRGPFGIEEPDPLNSTELSPSDPILVLCPAVAVDSNGVRLGMGKGYYDRFFANHPHAIAVAVVYQVQVSSLPLPADSWDQAMDWIVTDQMIFRVSRANSAQNLKRSS